MAHSFALTPSLIIGGLEPSIDFLGTPEGQALTTEAAQQARAGDLQAFYAPGVRLILDTTLNILERPEVEECLSVEVADRGASSSFIAQHVGGLLADRHILTRLYSADPQLSRVPLSRNDIEALSQPDYIASLGGAPFFDATKVVGGALRKLIEGSSVEASLRQQAIARSKNLLAISGIYKPFQHVAHEFLGNPYVKRELLDLSSDELGARVVFTPEARDILAGLSVEGRGCPAGRMACGNRTVLETYWDRMVAFFVPDAATATK